MTGPGDQRTPRLWGRQHPFERNHLQRALTLLGLAGTFGLCGTLLVYTDVAGVIGISLVCAGLLLGLAAVSRSRYVRESRLGFAALTSRDGRFVLGSAAAFAVVGLYVLELLLR